MDLADKNILVVGLGKTGIAVVRFLHKRNCRITVSDISSKDELASRLAAVPEMDVRMELGFHRTESFTTADLIVLSPGVPHTIAPIQRAIEKGIPVLSEIELASRFISEPIVAVTGTNGKTTTTTLLGELFRTAGIKAFVGGNIGNPLIDYVDTPERADIVVVEVSSFQLDTIDSFHPKVAVLLNIAADHLDRYPDFEHYAASKGRVFMNQTEDDIAILNGSDPNVLPFGQKLHSRMFTFCHAAGSDAGIRAGATIEPHRVAIGNGTGKKTVIELSGIKLVGKHNLENIAAACLAATVFGVLPASIETALKRFEGLPHRMEPVATRHDIHYVNDSKSTNIASVSRALESFPRPVILIMGGRNKGGDFHALKEQVRKYAKQIIAMGESKDSIHSILGQVIRTEKAVSMEEALALATAAAVPGDTVLLSPGCASFDMYANYAERGEAFRFLVEKL